MFADPVRAGKPPRTPYPILRAGGTRGPRVDGRVFNGGMDHAEPRLPDPEVTGAADRALLATVAALTDEQLAAPSLLPGWTRAHVVAHLALNGEALVGALAGVADGRAVPMYASQESRDRDIEGLAADPDDVRRRLADATEAFAAAAAALPDDLRDTRVERVPGGMTVRAASIPLMRWREVEIHHADLDAGATHADWSEEFAVALLDSMAHRPWPAPLRLEASDLDGTWEYGDPVGGAAVVTGSARDLGWWATGRGDGAGLTTDHDTLPEVQGW